MPIKKHKSGFEAAPGFTSPQREIAFALLPIDRHCRLGAFNR